MPVLEAINVAKDYGDGSVAVHAVRGVDVRVDRGEFLAIMGPSGCGKSTLLHMLGGIEEPTSGQVLLGGENFGGLNDHDRSIIRRRRIGFVFQKMNLLPSLSALDNVALPLRIDGLSRSQAHEKSRAALEQVGIADRASHVPHQLSGGEQQRVAVARALVISPSVILADEPTGALDSANGRRIVELLWECVKQGQTVVMVTHDIDVAQHADRILTMRDGRVDGETAPPREPEVARGPSASDVER